MNVMTSRKPLAVGLAAAIAMGGMFMPGATGTANAAPLSTNALALTEAVPSDVIDVRRRWRRHRGGAVFAGLALGIIGTAIAAHQYDRYHRRHYRHHYYDPYPYGYYHRPYHHRHRHYHFHW